MSRLLALLTLLLLAGCLRTPAVGEVWAIRNHDDPWCRKPRFLIKEIRDGQVRVGLLERRVEITESIEPMRTFVGPFSSTKLDPHNCRPKGST